MTLGQLKTALRAGQHPSQIGGEKLACGDYRCAWRVGCFVVKAFAKRHYDGDRYTRNHKVGPMRPRKATKSLKQKFKNLGGKVAPQVVANGWAIQLYYQPVPPKRNHLLKLRDDHNDWEHDISVDNTGFDRRGRYVALDW